MTALDPRLHAVRSDLADIGLKGRVEALRFSDGERRRIGVPVADLLRHPAPDASLDSQFLLGDPVRVFDQREGFAWVQGSRDRYVGYVEAVALAPEVSRADAATHTVAVPRTFSYAEPDMKRPRARALPLGAALAVTGHTETRGTRYALLGNGESVIAAHLRPVDEVSADYVAVAETLARTPYLWGGASAFGLDCAGLVQLSLRMTGRDAPRDSDLQAASLGDPLPENAPLRRGDLVFWRGHVAIMTNADTMIHANGHTMDVALEPLAAAIQRIGYLYGPPTGYRRL